MNRSLVRTVVPAALALVVAACGDDPVEPELQEIETVEFAASLGIDLNDFTELPSGVYIRDDVVGNGFVVEPGNTVILTIKGFLADGSVFQEEYTSEPASINGYIPGFIAGVLDMRENGQRRFLVPPALGYGSRDLTGGGEVIIPGGSVLIFDVHVDDVVE